MQSGKVVCVDKGEWDKGGTPEYVDQYFFHCQYIDRIGLQDFECRNMGKDQSAAQYFLSLFHLFHRVYHLGAEIA